MMIDTSDKTAPASEKHPKGACYFAYRQNRIDACVDRLNRQQCVAWLQKLDELEASDEQRQLVAGRLSNL